MIERAETRLRSRSDGVAGALAPREAVTPVTLRSAERFYHPELDVLRFFAFAFVFMLHGIPHEIADWTAVGVPEGAARWITSIVLSGQYGVDLFFTLSAYLITELLIREFQKRGTLDVKSFYIRRALRIWPLYFFFLGLVVLLVPRLLPDEYLAPVHRAAFLLFLANWSTAFVGHPSSVAGPLWSVSVEEQFYIAWPLLMSRLGVRRIFPTAMVMIALASVVRLVLVGMRVDNRVLWMVTFTRLEPIALGAILAVVLRGGAPLLSSGRRLLMFAGGVALWVLAVRYNVGGPANLVVYPVVAVGAAGMLLATLRDDSRSALLRSPVLTYLGRISYGLYVYHVLALHLVRQWLGATAAEPRFAFVLVPLAGMACTIAAAALSYRFIETPFLHLKRRFTHVRSRD